MLVLSRKKGESVVIDDVIIVTVLDIRGDKIRLGIEAPKALPIHRNEVYQAIADRTRINDIEQQIVEQAAEP